MRAAVAAALVVVLAASAGAGSPSERCAAGKLKAAGQKARARAQCWVRAFQRGHAVDADCLARSEQKFSSTWARLEAAGGCATTNDRDDVEGRVDTFVADLVAALPPTTSTSTTITTSSSCPPTTAFYCGINSPFCGSPSLCPSGMTCVDAGGGACTCTGAAIPCDSSSLKGLLCAWGTCPSGMACKMDPGSTSCPPSCSCQ
jgi:hypothetical protein